MVTQQPTIHDNISLPKNEYSIDTVAYPVDLSLFLNTSPVSHTSGDYSSASLAESEDPVAAVQYALAQWNDYVANKEEKSRQDFRRAALWLIEQGRRIRDDALGWPLTYSHPLYFTRGPWLSSHVQGCGLSVLARAYQLTGDQHFLETAHLVAHTLERDILDGGVCSPIAANGIFFEEVAVYPAAHTLNGSIFALLGLYDYAVIPGNGHIQQLIQRGEATLHTVLDEFDLGFWTHIDLLRRGLTTPAQLAQQTALLEALAKCRGCPLCRERASRWRGYLQGRLSRLRYWFARNETLLKQVLLRGGRTLIMPQSRSNLELSQCLRVCVPVSDYPSPGGVKTFLDRVAQIMADRWQIEYVTQYVRPEVGDRVIHKFGKAWMTPWHFPQICFYILAGMCKLLSLMYQGANYDLILPQDGVFSGTFAALVGKLTGVRVVCFDHSTLTWYRSQAYHAEAQAYLDRKAWPLLFHQLVRFSRIFYWPSLYILARFATSQIDHLMSPGVTGDEIDEICRNLRIPLSRVTRFNLIVDMPPQEDFSAENRAARRSSMGIPSDALVITITVRLDREKGLDISMESISHALSSLPPALRDRVRVIIAGDGELRGWLEEEIRKKRLNDVCQMRGHISNKDVYSLLAISDISLHTSTRCACMPTAVLEGMAAGCAVIASDVPLATTHVLGEGRGIVVPVGDVEQTSKALEQLLRDKDLRERMGKAAREYIALHHSAEAFYKILLRMSYWSGLDELLEIQAASLGINARAESGC